MGRITQLSDGENTQGFDYDKVGRLVQQRQYRLNANGMVESQALHYHYDKNGNRTKLTLPNKDEIHSLYYGSGHLSAIKYNDSLITEISRGKLHQELARTQGKLTTQFKRDPLGRLAQQLAVLESSHTPLVQRSYEYDLVGNLIQTQDKRFGTTNYRYDKLGQIQLAGQELFHFDPAHNIIERESERIQNNQVTTYQGVTYRYDEFGNLSQRTLPNGEVQSYAYNAKDKLVEVAIQKPNQTIERWQYQYDVLGRRISKRLENQDNLQEFIWDGSHLVQEIDHKTNRTYCYIYSHPNSYEPLAQLVFAKNSEKPTACTTYYYHNDQIGVPRELTDEDGKLCWYGDYTGWGKLKDEYALVENIHQPFRLQNQYCDSETGLHYNFFRYYEPNVGRFTQLDPIGLAGGNNLYRFAKNTQRWTDPLGLNNWDGFMGISSEWASCEIAKSKAYENMMVAAQMNPNKSTDGFEITFPILGDEHAVGVNVTSELQSCVYYRSRDTIFSQGTSEMIGGRYITSSNLAMRTGETEYECAKTTTPSVRIRGIPVSYSGEFCSSPSGGFISTGPNLGIGKGRVGASKCTIRAHCQAVSN